MTRWHCSSPPLVTERTPHAVVRHVVVFGRVLREGGLEVGPGRVARRCAASISSTWRGRTTSTGRSARRWSRVARTSRPSIAPSTHGFSACRARGASASSTAAATGRAPQGRRSRPWPRDRRRRARSRRVERRRGAPHARLRDHEPGGVRARALTDPRDRTRAAAPPDTPAAGRPPRIDAGRPRARPSVARHRRRSGDSDVPHPRNRAAQARAAPGRLGLDGGVLACAPALPPRGAGLGPRRRDVRVRHPPDAADVASSATRDPDAALAAAAARVLDWAGGTRIGASLKAYNDEWGKRALTRGAVVVVLSDGCERGDPRSSGTSCARLARQAFAVVWVNPLKGHPDYEPLTAGMSAALPLRRPPAFRARRGESRDAG